MPGRFTVHLTRSFQRDLERLPAVAQRKIVESLKHLEHSPVAPPPKIKKLKGEGVGRWRLEVWPYRVRYDVEGANVILYRVRHRKDIYR